VNVYQNAKVLHWLVVVLSFFFGFGRETTYPLRRFVVENIFTNFIFLNYQYEITVNFELRFHRYPL